MRVKESSHEYASELYIFYVCTYASYGLCTRVHMRIMECVHVYVSELVLTSVRRRGKGFLLMYVSELYSFDRCTKAS